MMVCFVLLINSCSKNKTTDPTDTTLTSIFINPANVILDIGQTQQLTITTTPENANPSVSWSSSNPSVATISTSGEVTAISTGQATITAVSILAPSVTATRIVNVNVNPTATVIISLSTIDGGSVIGANVVLQNHAGSAYSETATSSNVIFTNIPFGTYSLLVSHGDYLDYNQESLSVQSTTVTHEVILTTYTISIGDIILFGAHQWLVLALQDDRALIISENVLEQSTYHESFTSITWENCTLRQYLNGTFYNTFSEANKARIAEVTNVNLDNQYYGTKGGNNTQDKIFLLSLEEVVQYFGDSGQLGNNNYISDQYNSNRIAFFNGSAVWWWLRSPGYNIGRVSEVYSDGHIHLDGAIVNYNSGGVRPALWLNL